MAKSRRDHLIDTAVVLFNREGYHATGIDRILAESGVAKMTLYKHFNSKNDLILAVLRRRDEAWMRWFQGAIERRTGTPEARIPAIFDALDEWFGNREFHGCMFIKAASEFPGPDDPIHISAARHHRDIMAYLKTLAVAAGVKRPARLARELMLLVEGAIAVTQVNGRVGAAQEAARVAKSLVAHAKMPES